MMKSVSLEGADLPVSGEYDLTSAATDASGLSKGSFSLRRANYFNNTRHQKIISHKLRIAPVHSIAKDEVVRNFAF